MKKNIVIIAYSTYPSNDPRSMRTHELASELVRQGNNVTLYVMTRGYNYKEYEKKTKIKVRSLGKSIFFKFDHNLGMQLNIPSKIIRRLFGKYLEYPSIELIRNTYFVLQQEENIDNLITIAIPYPIHWGAALYRRLHAHKMQNTTWIADCGDPYMGNPYTKKPSYFEYLERLFCEQADYITIPVSEAKQAYYYEFHDKIKIIPQGFPFPKEKDKSIFIPNSSPIFIYAGNFYRDLRDPRPLLEYLSTLDINFTLIIYTKTTDLIESYKEKLGEKLKVLSYIPREDLINEMSKADFLLNIENRSNVQSPSKLIDYAIAGRPILSINTNQPLNKKLIKDFLENDYSNSLKIPNIEQYNIENVAKEFIKLMND